MADSNHDDPYQLTVFYIEEVFVFTHYFDDQYIYSQLKSYYNTHQYRFEVPDTDYPAFQSLLEDRGYEIEVIKNTTPYTVAIKKYTAHPENIFKASVMQRRSDGYNCFLMTDQKGVQQAVTNGAIKLSQTDLKNPFDESPASD